jgi:hypothetical protein
VRIENIAPWTMLKSGVGGGGAIGPGQGYELTFTAGKGHRLSFAAMLGESNDWFFAPAAAGIALYDANGAPVKGDVTDQIALWDAGTEINQEPAVGDSTGPKQSGPDVGAPDPDPTVRQLGDVITLTDGTTFPRPAIKDMIRVTITSNAANRSFTVRIDNVSTDTTLVTSAGAKPIHISPAVWTVHTAPNAIFEPGMPDRGLGLEQLAESGRTYFLASNFAELSGAATPISPGVVIVHPAGVEPIFSHGLPDRGLGLERIAENGDPTALADALHVDTFRVPVGASAPGAAKPGTAYEFDLVAQAGDRLSFATMFGMSNDWFFGTEPGGMALFDAGGVAIEGDVTEAVGLYNAGTEVDQEPGVGPDTGPQQAMPDQGAPDPIRQVREIAAHEYDRPVGAHLRVTLTVVH